MTIPPTEDDCLDDILAVRLDQGAHERERFIFTGETTEEISGIGI